MDEEGVVRETLRILQGILSAMQGVVGEGAAQALLRYGAFEEGQRLAADHAATDLDGAFAIVRRITRLDGAVLRDDHGMRIVVHGCPVLGPRSPVLDTLLLGLFEGAFHGALHRRIKGRIVDRHDDGSATLAFEHEAP